jgi:hypothetical protein
MDIWQMIRSDHALTIELCREIADATGGSGGRDRDRLFQQLHREVERQMRAKEQVLYSGRGPQIGSGRAHAEIRDRLDELAGYRDKGSREWTRRFDDFTHMLEHHFDMEEHGLGAALGALDSRQADDLRRRYEREKIAALQAQRWHLPVAMMPRRYGVSERTALGIVAGVAALAVIGAAWRSRSAREWMPGSARPGRSRRPSAYFSPGGTPGMLAREMIGTHPDVKGNINEALIRCIEECYSCAQACTACADACLGEDMVKELRQCIRLNLDCADVCAATGAVASRRTGSNEEVIRQMLQACAAACRLCGDECERHAGHHEHCHVCAQSCRRCEQACQDALRSMR